MAGIGGSVCARCGRAGFRGPCARLVDDAPGTVSLFDWEDESGAGDVERAVEPTPNISNASVVCYYRSPMNGILVVRGVNN